MSTKFRDVEVGGKAHEVFIQSDGQFMIVLDGSKVTDKTYDGVVRKAQARVKLKIADFKLPFVAVEHCEAISWHNGHKPELRKGVATGLHNSNNNILVRWSDQKDAEQMSGYRHGMILHELSVNEEARFNKLLKTWWKAREEFIEFLAKHEIELKQEVEDGIRKRLGVDPEDTSGED